MLPSSYFRSDASTSGNSEQMKMESDLYWGGGGGQHHQSHQQIDPLTSQHMYQLQALGDVGFYRSDSSTSSSSAQLQALRDFMSQGTSNMPMYPQHIVTPPPLLVQDSLTDFGMRGNQYFDKTPHRTQFQRESHIIAERQRREEMNDKFASLRAMLPKSSKKDKASIVGDTINYVMELEKKLKQLQASKAKKGSQQIDLSTEQRAETVPRIPVQVEVQSIGEQAVIKLICCKSPKLVLRILTALEQCRVEVLQSNVTTLGDTAVHFFTIELTPGISATTEEITAALEAAASNSLG